MPEILVDLLLLTQQEVQVAQTPEVVVGRLAVGKEQLVLAGLA